MNCFTEMIVSLPGHELHEGRHEFHEGYIPCISMFSMAPWLKWFHIVFFVSIVPFVTLYASCSNKCYNKPLGFSNLPF